MIVTYRDACVDDAPLVERLFRESYIDTFGHLYAAEDLANFLSDATEAVWRKELADPEMRFRLAFAGEKLAGFARTGPGNLPKQRPERAVELRQLYLLPPFKGQGIAPALMDWVIADARARNAANLYLSVFVDNPRARRFYDRYGFVEEGPYEFVVGNHVDKDLVMRLAL